MSQSIIDGLISAGWIMIVAGGFGLIFYCARFFHFAHGGIFTAGAYVCFFFKVWLGFPLLISIFFAIALGTTLGCLIEIYIYRSLRRKKASSLILLLASLGIYIIIQNIISLIFGNDTKSIRLGTIEEGINIFGARITSTQLLIISISIILVYALWILLKKTKIGKAIQAVAIDPELASVSGISCNRVILWTFGIGSALASVAGILVALDVDMNPAMGMNALMMGMVATIIGGTGSMPGLALGSLFIGMAQHLGVWKASSNWQDAIAFSILLIFLLLRPQGILGRKSKKAVL